MPALLARAFPNNRMLCNGKRVEMTDLAPESSPRVNIIGVPVSVVNMSTTLDIIEDGLNSGIARGEYICVSNVHTTVMAHDDSAYCQVQSESFLTLPDGKPLALAGSRVAPEMDRVTGPDLMREIFAKPSMQAYSHYFYGNTASNVGALIEKLHFDYPDLKIAGFEPSIFRPLSENEEVDLCRRIESSQADFVWVGLGAPRQEMLCAQLKGRTHALMVGVGGAFNVLAGITPEAPRWMQNASLEWLYRLAQEPKRLFKRYASTNTRFLYLLAKEGCSRVE